MAKEKVFTFEDQLERMNELFGVGKEDAINVFVNFKKTMETVIREESTAGTEHFTLENPFVSTSLKWKKEENRINANDGAEYVSPAHYVASFGIPSWTVDIANENVDFSSVPNSSDIKASKAA